MKSTTMSSQPDLWVWKAEPVSPSGTSVGEGEDDWLYTDDSKSTSLLNNSTSEPELYDQHPSRAQLATKLLEELDEWIKEEPFSDWLEEKIDLPIFEELPAPECGQNKPVIYPGKHHLDHQETTQTLLQEFESVLGDVEACHQIYPPVNLALTPPQSPPPNKLGATLDTQLLVTLQPVLQAPFYNAQRSLQLHSHNQQQQEVSQQVTEVQDDSTSYLGQISGGWNAENVSLVPLRDVASELAAVDEFVRSCAEDIAPASPCPSSNESFLSSEDSSSPDDPDWTGESSSNSGSYSNKQRSSRLTKNRHKPYSRPNVVDKKVRKKEQNKNAATRYRQKKKQEVKEIIGEEQELVDYNDKLHDQVKELNREIGYLKGLMRDLFKAKGLMK